MRQRRWSDPADPIATQQVTLRQARQPNTPARADPDSAASRLMGLQRTAGNRAVASMVAASVQRAAKRGQQPPTTSVEGGDGLPKTPTIAASASGVLQGGSFGGHATVFLAAPGPEGEDGPMQHYFIDLMIDQESSRKKAIAIRIMPMRGSWPTAATSTSWSISGAQAMTGLARAQDFQANQAKYTYSRLGIGFRRYNCALFVEEILKAAGVRQTAGRIISTPLEVAMGKKLPGRRKREPKAAKGAAAPIPRQYEV